MTISSRELAKKQAIAKLQSRAISGVVTGSGIAAGAAATELAFAGAATAAEGVAVTAEAIAIAPFVLTAAAIGGTVYGAYRIAKWLAD